MSPYIKSRLAQCETLEEMLSVLNHSFDLSGKLSYSKKVIIMAGLDKAIQLVNPPKK